MTETQDGISYFCDECQMIFKDFGKAEQHLKKTGHLFKKLKDNEDNVSSL